MILDIIDGFSCRWSPIISNFIVASPKQANSSGSKTSLASSTRIANGFVFLMDSSRPMHPTIVPPITAFFSYTSDFALTLALWYSSRAISISVFRLLFNFASNDLYFCSCSFACVHLSSRFISQVQRDALISTSLRISDSINSSPAGSSSSSDFSSTSLSSMT